MKKLAIVGSTGSIGTQTVDVIKHNINKFDIVFITAHTNTEKLTKQIDDLNPKYAVITGKAKLKPSKGCKILYGAIEIINLIKNEQIDLLMVSSSGLSGIIPTYEALSSGINVAIANKETIVSGGKIITTLAKARRKKIIPVDSEHSAIFQSLMGQNSKYLSKVTLTASGGPFRNRNANSFDSITVEEALAHPIWSMGRKITIDSATMMNKGLEIIEAHYLFNLPYDKLDILIHPQSIIHSMVSFNDGSSIAQMGYPDMRSPISFALGYPERLFSGVQDIELEKISSLTFHKPDYKKYKSLSIVYDILKENKNNLMVVLNAANEIAVEYFLKKMISFTDIPNIIVNVLDFFVPKDILDINEIIEIDRQARKKTKDLIKRKK